MKRGEAFTRVHNPLQDLRIEHGYSVKDVADYLGMSSATVSKIFNGKQAITPKVKEGLMELFDLGYGQICDACNRMVTFHYSGDIRTRSIIQDEPEVEDIAEEPVEVPEEPVEVPEEPASKIVTVTLQEPVTPIVESKFEEVRQDPDCTREKILDIVYGKITRQEYIELERLLQYLH